MLNSKQHKMMWVTEFEPWHLRLLPVLRNDAEHSELLRSTQHGQWLKEAGNAFSAWVPEGLVACVGVGIRPHDGRPEAWLIGGPLIDRYRFSFHRKAKRMLESMSRFYGWPEVFTTTNKTDTRAERWIRALGFQPVEWPEDSATPAEIRNGYHLYRKEYV